MPGGKRLNVAEQLAIGKKKMRSMKKRKTKRKKPIKITVKPPKISKTKMKRAGKK